MNRRWGQINEESAGRGIILITAVFYQHIIKTIIKSKEQRKFIYNRETVLPFNFFPVFLLTNLPLRIEKSRQSKIHES